MSTPFEPPAGAPQQPVGYGAPQSAGYGAPAYGTPPVGYGAQGGGVVGPGGEWLGPPLASWGTRVGGYLIDVVIAVVVVVLVGLVSEALSQVANIAILIGFGYLTGTTGQTPGRKVVGAKVVRLSDGQVLGAGAGIGRQFLHILDSLPLLLGYLWPIWDKKNQTFADKIIGSVVIKA